MSGAPWEMFDAPKSAPAPEKAAPSGAPWDHAFEEAPEVKAEPTILERLAGAPERIGNAILHFLGQAVNPANLGATIGEAVRMAPQVVEASAPDLSKTRTAFGQPLPVQALNIVPDEAKQGAFNALATLPSALLVDLPEAGSRLIADTLLGPGTSDAAERASAKAAEEMGLPQLPKPPGSQTVKALVESFAPNAFGKAEEELTPREKTERRIGEFGASAVPFGAKALMPSVAAAPMVRIAEEVAPEDPAWQLFAAATGAILPEVVARTKSTLGRIKSPLPAVTKKGAEARVGEKLLEATEGQPLATKTDLPPGYKPTTTETDARIRGVQTDALKNDKTLGAALQSRAEENIKALRGAVEETGGQGIPETARQFADDALLAAEERSRDALSALRGSTPQPVLADRAGTLLNEQLGKARAQANAPWEKLREIGAQASVDFVPLSKKIDAWLNSLTRSERQDIARNADITSKLNLIKQLAGESADDVQITRYGPDGQPIAPAVDEIPGWANVFEMQDIRSGLGGLARRIGSGMDPDPNLARLANDAAKIVAEHMDGKGPTGVGRLEFENKAIQPLFQEAREAWRAYTERFRDPLLARRVMGHDAQGADIVSPAGLLEKFDVTGPKGRDAMRTLMAMDDSLAMQETVASNFAAELQKLPTTAKAADKWLRDHTDALVEMDQAGARAMAREAQRVAAETKKQAQALSAISGEPIVQFPQPVASVSWFEKFRQIVDDRAAFEALQKSPLGLFAGVSPRTAVDNLFNHPDMLNAGRELRRQVLTQPNGRQAWRGIQRAYADRMIEKITGTSGEVVSADKLSAFLGRYGELNDILLQSKGNKLLTAIQDAARRMETAAAKGGAVPENLRYLDYVADGIVTGGMTYTSGPLTGVLSGAGFHFIRDALRARSAAVMREALIDQSYGDLLMQRASAKAQKSLPRAKRPLFDDLMFAAPGIVAQEAAQAARRRAAPTGPVRLVPAAKQPPAKPKPERQSQAPAPVQPNQRTASNGRRYIITPMPGGKFAVEVAAG